MKICSAIINLFHLIPAAPQTLVKPLLEVVMKTERAMLIEVMVKFRINSDSSSVAYNVFTVLDLRGIHLNSIKMLDINVCFCSLTQLRGGGMCTPTTLGR